jgi:hypothetical protein
VTERRRAGDRAPGRGEAGLTLVELMVSGTLSTIVIGMTFAMVVQVSAAYRFQARLAELQQGLVAAEAVLLRDVRQAGLMVPDGFRVAWDNDIHQPLEITNASDGPDELSIAAADPSAQARVLSFGAARDRVKVDDGSAFRADDLVVISDTRATGVSATIAPQAYDACVLRLVDATDTELFFDVTSPWGVAGNPHCAAVATSAAGVAADTMVFRLTYRRYRIDPDRPELGVLQRSVTGAVENDWEDLGLGFTDLQVATRWAEPGDVVDTDDPDTDAQYDWYSSGEQDQLSAPAAVEGTRRPVEVAISVVVRTTRELTGTVSDKTPELTVAGNPDNNPIGDRASVQLEGIPDALRPPALRGDHSYRWHTFRVDLRNLGVGR